VLGKGGRNYLRPAGNTTTGPLWLKGQRELRLEAGATISQKPESRRLAGRFAALLNSNGRKEHRHYRTRAPSTEGQYEYAPMRGLTRDQKRVEIAAGRRRDQTAITDRRSKIHCVCGIPGNSHRRRSLVNAPLWTVAVCSCDQVWIRGVYIYSRS